MADEEFILNPNTDQAVISRRNVRIIMIGTAEDVEREILRAHLLRFSEVADWSRPLRTPNGKEALTRNPDEVMRIWKRYLIYSVHKLVMNQGVWGRCPTQGWNPCTPSDPKRDGYR